MKSFTTSLPNSKDRSVLRDQGRIQEILFTRNYTPTQVGDVIRQGFANLGNFSAFKFLESTNGQLYVPDHQGYDGVKVIDRRGALYLCEVCKTI